MRCMLAGTLIVAIGSALACSRTDLPIQRTVVNPTYTLCETDAWQQHQVFGVKNGLVLARAFIDGNSVRVGLGSLVGCNTSGLALHHWEGGDPESVTLISAEADESGQHCAVLVHDARDLGILLRYSVHEGFREIWRGDVGINATLVRVQNTGTLVVVDGNRILELSDRGSTSETQIPMFARYACSTGTSVIAGDDSRFVVYILGDGYSDYGFPAGVRVSQTVAGNGYVLAIGRSGFSATSQLVMVDLLPDDGIDFVRYALPKGTWRMSRAGDQPILWDRGAGRILLFRRGLSLELVWNGDRKGMTVVPSLRSDGMFATFEGGYMEFDLSSLPETVPAPPIR